MSEVTTSGPKSEPMIGVEGEPAMTGAKDEPAMTRIKEVPVYFQAAGEDLFGVITLPHQAPPQDIGVILLAGGSFIPAPNRNRLSVHLARRLAVRGFHVMRFDYHGVGESTGEVDVYHLTRPFVDDLAAAARCLAAAGPERVVLMGSCFGSRTIVGAAERIPGLVGVVLMSTPVRDMQMGDRAPTRLAEQLSVLQLVGKAARPRTWRNLLRPVSREAYLRARQLYVRTAAVKARQVLDRLPGRRQGTTEGPGASAHFLGGFKQLIDRAIPVLMIYGREDDFYLDFNADRDSRLGTLLARADGRMEIELIDGVLHGFTTLRSQEDVLERIESWVGRRIEPGVGNGQGPLG